MLFPVAKNQLTFAFTFTIYFDFYNRRWALPNNNGGHDQLIKTGCDLI